MKAGDVVKLKSGGRVMTVEDSFYSSNRGSVVSCVWYCSNDGVCREEFNENVLEIFVSKKDMEAPALKKVPQPSDGASL